MENDSDKLQRSNIVEECPLGGLSSRWVVAEKLPRICSLRFVHISTFLATSFLERYNKNTNSTGPLTEELLQERAQGFKDDRKDVKARIMG